MNPELDVVVIGSGPNGLAAAIVVAQAGHRPVVYEAQPTIGGGMRSAAFTLPGFTHDICSAVHPFAAASPFFKTLPLASLGLEWIEPPVMLAHPFDDGSAAVVYRSIEETAAGLGADADAYRRLMAPIVNDWPRLESSILGPLRWPGHPLTLAAFGLQAFRSVQSVATASFSGEPARALFGGIAAHSMLPLDRALTAGVALVLGAVAHVAGWVIPRRGSQAIADALVAHLRSLGGEVKPASPVKSLRDLPASRAVLCDLSPRPLLDVAGDRFSPSYRRALERYRYGMGVFKMDWALSAPIPWRNAECRRAGTLHLGGTLSELSASEQDAWDGRISDRPYVLLAQPSVHDPTRAPAGQHTAWAYCHVPSASTVDMTARVEAQIERFAPGFRDTVLARHTMAPADIERHNANFVGGDIASGVTDIRQFFTRPTWREYSTSAPDIFICSAATPPGVGVHGMCGYFAAKRALKACFGNSG